MPSCPVCRAGIDPASILTENEIFESQLVRFLEVGYESPREIDRVVFSVGAVAICLGSIAFHLII